MMKSSKHIVWGVIVLVLLAGCIPPGEPEVMVVTVEVPASTDPPTESVETIPPTALPETALPPAPTEAAEQSAVEASAGVLQTVRDRGRLICGINGDLPGFSKFEEDGRYTGFDVDFCRVVAAAIFGNANAIEFRTLSAADRFAALRSGEVDVLFRNTTWTATRDNATEQLDFGPTTFHDGQGFMVSNTFDVNTSVEELDGLTICVTGETTTEANLRDQFQALGIEFTPVILPDTNETFLAYDDGQCEAVTADRSQLVAKRTELSSPDDHVILDAIISREPLGPAMVEDDSQWRDVVSWSVFATIYAEELGVNRANVAQQLESDDPNVRRLLGLDGTIGADLGLDDDFAFNIIDQVGNYADIYDHNLGPDTPFDLERGPNKAWNRGQGGVLASPPFR